MGVDIAFGLSQTGRLVAAPQLFLEKKILMLLTTILPQTAHVNFTTIFLCSSEETDSIDRKPPNAS